MEIVDIPTSRTRVTEKPKIGGFHTKPLAVTQNFFLFVFNALSCEKLFIFTFRLT